MIRHNGIIASSYAAAGQIWDIGGQSIGSKMLSNYIFGSQVPPCLGACI
jgi:hypothetical protein